MSLEMEIMKYTQSLDLDSEDRRIFMNWAIRASHLESNAKHESMYFNGQDTKVYVKENKDTGYADIEIDTPRTNIQCWMKTHSDRYGRNIPYDMVSVQNKIGKSDIVSEICGVQKNIPSIHGLKTMVLKIIAGY
jgi:hypothetical protein